MSTVKIWNQTCSSYAAQMGSSSSVTYIWVRTSSWTRRNLDACRPEGKGRARACPLFTAQRWRLTTVTANKPLGYTGKITEQKFCSLTLVSFNLPGYIKVALEQDCTWAISTHIKILNGFSSTTHTELDTWLASMLQWTTSDKLNTW